MEDLTGKVGGATFPTTFAGDDAMGTCLPGWSGSATRTCQLDGRWASSVSVSCKGALVFIDRKVLLLMLIVCIC